MGRTRRHTHTHTHTPPPLVPPYAHTHAHTHTLPVIAGTDAAARAAGKRGTAASAATTVAARGLSALADEVRGPLGAALRDFSDWVGPVRVNDIAAAWRAPPPRAPTRPTRTLLWLLAVRVQTHGTPFVRDCHRRRRRAAPRRRSCAAQKDAAAPHSSLRRAICPPSLNPAHGQRRRDWHVRSGAQLAASQ